MNKLESNSYLPNLPIHTMMQKQKWFLHLVLLIHVFFLLIFMKKVDIRPIFRSRIFIFIIIYLVYMFCTLFWAEEFEMKNILKYGRRVIYIIIFLAITVHLIKNYQHFFSKLIPFVFSISAIVAILTIIIFYTQHPFPSTNVINSDSKNLWENKPTRIL